MTITSINGYQPIYQSQNLSNQQAVDSDNANDRNSVNSANGGRHHRDGAFMQDIIKSLQATGLNFPTQTVNKVENTDTSDNSTATNTSNPRQALHQLMHDLRQALQQTGSQQTTAANSTGAGNDSSGSNSVVQNNGYSNFGTNLQSLISTLGNNSGSTNSVTDKLQSDFSSLVQALNNGNTNNTTAKTEPSLQQFLTNLQNNIGSHADLQTGAGSLLHLSA
ncbi:MAG: hypothetical protein ACXWF8_10525 [Methylobacter sp.]